jgi:hypothetical protein
MNFLTLAGTKVEWTFSTMRNINTLNMLSGNLNAVRKEKCFTKQKSMTAVAGNATGKSF